jgi:hypothetical protein
MWAGDFVRGCVSCIDLEIKIDDARDVVLEVVVGGDPYAIFI